jgi:glutathione S-transferase
MKLRYTPPSPFVRKVLVLAIEAGLRERIELVPTKPWDPGTDLPLDNPLGKVPALVTDEAGVLYDSRVICEYLDLLHDGSPFFPSSGARRWRVLRRQALADGIMDAAVLRVPATGWPVKGARLPGGWTRSRPRSPISATSISA